LSKITFRISELSRTPDTLPASDVGKSGVWNGWFGCSSGCVALGTLVLCGCTTFLLFGGGVDPVLETRIDLLNNWSRGLDEKSSNPGTSCGYPTSGLTFDGAGSVGDTWLIWRKSSDVISSTVGWILAQLFCKNKMLNHD